MTTSGRFWRWAPVLLLFAGLAFGQQRELKPGFNLFSKNQDIQLGKEASAQIEKEVRLVQDRSVNEYVQRIGRRLASQPEADQYPYTFKVVLDENINAFALPGGPTYMHTGLIMAAENESQLAGVVAHEIAHVALRHGTNQASKANLIQLPALLAGALVGGGSLMSQLAQLGIGLGANSVLLKFSRNAERDADLLGTRIMAGAGYNPIEMARFFEKLEAEGGSRSNFLQFLSSHPNPGNRTKSVEEEIQYLPRQRYDADSGQLPQIQRTLAGIRPPEPAKKDASSAVTPASPAGSVSSRLRHYQGREFSLSYPADWETYGYQDSAMVTIAPPEGLVKTPQGGTAIGFGVMMSYYFSQDDRRVDLNRDTQRLIAELQRSNPTLRVPRQRSRRITVGRQPALVHTLNSDSPYSGQTEIDMLVTVARPEGLFYMVFVAPQDHYRNVQSTFELMLQSVQFSN